MKRSAWATPAGIDHDYNYLKSVERKVEVASQDVKERGISVRDPAKGGPNAMGQRTVAKAWMPGSALQRYLAENAIHVEKAPAGMSRQRANRTRTTNKGKVMWTVEWVQSDGSRSVDNESHCESTIGELWEVIEAKKVNAEQGKKRKRVAAVTNRGPTKSANSGSGNQPRRPLHPALNSEVGVKDEHREDSQHAPSIQDNVPFTNSENIEDQDRPTPSSLKPEDASDARGAMAPVRVKPEHSSDHEDEEPSRDSKREEKANHNDEGMLKSITDEDMIDPSVEDRGTRDQSRPPQLHFYLIKPLTASNRRVLIPIEHTATLTACLRGRTVLEFPTIHVLTEGPETLPAGYQLEESYTQGFKAEQQEVDRLLHQSKQSVGGAVHAAEVKEKPLDANSILDMLQRDLGR